MSSWRDSSPYLNRTSTTRTEEPQEGNAPIRVSIVYDGSITTACLPEGMQSGGKRPWHVFVVCSGRKGSAAVGIFSANDAVTHDRVSMTCA